jgi:hypothetical protein
MRPMWSPVSASWYSTARHELALARLQFLGGARDLGFEPLRPVRLGKLGLTDLQQVADAHPELRRLERRRQHVGRPDLEGVDAHLAPVVLACHHHDGNLRVLSDLAHAHGQGEPAPIRPIADESEIEVEVRKLVHDRGGLRINDHGALLDAADQPRDQRNVILVLFDDQHVHRQAVLLDGLILRQNPKG